MSSRYLHKVMGSRDIGAADGAAPGSHRGGPLRPRRLLALPRTPGRLRRDDSPTPSDGHDPRGDPLCRVACVGWRGGRLVSGPRAHGGAPREPRLRVAPAPLIPLSESDRREGGLLVAGSAPRVWGPGPGPAGRKGPPSETF